MPVIYGPIYEPFVAQKSRPLVVGHRGANRFTRTRSPDFGARSRSAFRRSSSMFDSRDNVPSSFTTKI
jgi:hypothetical protein